MKKHLIIGITALLLPVLTGCVDMEYRRGPITQRGNAIYNTWTSEMYKLNTIVHHYVFALNDILQAGSEAKADSIYKQYFSDNDQLTTHADGVYQIWNNWYGSSNPSAISYLVMTDGNDLNEAGTAWKIILNVPEGYVYQPAGQKKTSPTEPPYYDERVSCGEPYLPFVITCTAADTWTWKDANPDGESLLYFSIDCTVKKVLKEIVPGLVVERQYSYTGKGRFCVDDTNNKHTYLDYEMTDMLSANQRYAFNWVGGMVNLTARGDQPNEEIPVYVSVSPKSHAVTYGGITEDYNYQ